MAKYAAALDQGTTSTRAMVFDHAGHVVSVAQHEHRQIYPKPGWVEHDPIEIWERSRQVLEEVLDNTGIDTGELCGLGITNQRETTVVWDRQSGRPIYNAIVWQDTRTDQIVAELGGDAEGGQDRFRATTGLPLAPYFSGP
jgi:glycerol kinase